MKLIDDLDLGRQVEIPIDGMDFYRGGAGYALENFITSWGDWINFVGQVLYMIQMEQPYDKPITTNFHTELFEYPEEPSIIIPKLIFDEGSWFPLHHDFVGLLMNSAITQLVTIYELDF